MKVTPLPNLPSDHPAIEYIASRNYDADTLWETMRASYCYDEEQKPDTPEMPGGWLETPQGRIIFYVDKLGEEQGWHARALEKIEDGWKWFWHPYREEWDNVFDGSGTHFTLKEGYDGWAVRKYIQPPGYNRKADILGLDQAKEWNEGRDNSVVFLVEGPLDVARIGPPAVSPVGIALSAPQVELLTDFDHIVIIPDSDSAGRLSLRNFTTSLKQKGLKFSSLEVPKGYKDISAMPYDEAQALIAPYVV